jgi:hypothetical protein
MICADFDGSKPGTQSHRNSELRTGTQAEGMNALFSGGLNRAFVYLVVKSPHGGSQTVRVLSAVAAVLIVFLLLPWFMQRIILIGLIAYLVMNGLAKMIADRTRK